MCQVAVQWEKKLGEELDTAKRSFVQVQHTNTKIYEANNNSSAIEELLGEKYGNN